MSKKFSQTGRVGMVFRRQEAKKILSAFVGVIWLLGMVLSPSLLWAADVRAGSATSCLWEVQSEDNTVFLLGSIHLLKKDDYPLNEAIYRAFDRASRVVFEVNLDELSSPMVQMESLGKGMFTNGQNLKEVLSPEGYAAVRRYLRQQGMDISMFQVMKPWLVATTITTLELQKLGFEMDQGVDAHFFRKAKAAQKDVYGLETVQYQLGLFDNLSLDTQERFLLQTLDELALLKKETAQIVEAWRHGEVEGLKVMLESMRQFPEVFEALVTRRNLNWLTHIESYLQDTETYFVVVGTMHLVGEQGLLAMLESNGYRITQW